jgi:hypothetical protein
MSPVRGPVDAFEGVEALRASAEREEAICDEKVRASIMIAFSTALFPKRITVQSFRQAFRIMLASQKLLAGAAKPALSSGVCATRKLGPHRHASDLCASNDDSEFLG